VCRRLVGRRTIRDEEKEDLETRWSNGTGLGWSAMVLQNAAMASNSWADERDGLPLCTGKLRKETDGGSRRAGLVTSTLYRRRKSLKRYKNIKDKLPVKSIVWQFLLRVFV